MRRLSSALELPPATVDDAVRRTDELFAARVRKAESRRREESAAERAEWLTAFEPHAILQTEHTRPSSIVACAMTGGLERWLTVRFDLTQPPLTFAGQVGAALQAMTGGRDGRLYVTFFGQAVGFVINYAPAEAVRFDLDGSPLEVLAEAYRPGEVELSIGGRPLSPAASSRISSP